MKESGVEKSEVRQFRARPLYITEPVPVYYFTPQVQKRHAELFRWLQSEEGKRRDQVQVLDSEGRVIQAEPWLEQTEWQGKIDVPRWTLVASKNEKESGSSPLPETPFHRFHLPTIENVAYLADDDDSDWIKKWRVSLLAFERIMTSLEKLHLQQLKTKMKAELKNGRLCLNVPSDEEVLSLEEAVTSLANCGKCEVERVYAYWIGKRREYKKPLLSEMWNVFPWSVILDHSFQSRAATTSQKRRDSLENPFEGSIVPAHIPSAKLPLEEQLHRLHMIRQDLEVARTLADQVRRQEKLKKKRNELLLAEIQQEISCMLSPDQQNGLQTCLLMSKLPKSDSTSLKPCPDLKASDNGKISLTLDRRKAAIKNRGQHHKKRQKRARKAKERFTASQRVLRSQRLHRINGRR